MPITPDDQDPLSDAFAPADDSPTACVRCQGDRFIQVRPAYAERKYPGDLDALAQAVHDYDARLAAMKGDPIAGSPDLSNTEEFALLTIDRASAWQAWDDLRLLRATADRDVYPCPACNETLFLRWSAGCLSPNHHAATCERCLAVLGKKAASAHDRHAFPAEPVK